MSRKGAESAAPDAAAPLPQPLNILDAVCVLYFAASGQLNLLVDILTAANYRILLPAEVLNEVRNKASSKGWNIGALDYHLRGGPVHALPRSQRSPRRRSRRQHCLLKYDLGTRMSSQETQTSPAPKT